MSARRRPLLNGRFGHSPGRISITKAANARLLTARAAYHAGDFAIAHRRAKAALRAIENGSRRRSHMHAITSLAKLRAIEGTIATALTSFRRAVEIVEQMRGGIAADEFKATFLGDKIEVYEDAIRACLDEGGGDVDRGSVQVGGVCEIARARRSAGELHARGAATPNGATGRKRNASKLLKLIEELNWHSSHANLEDEKGGQRRAVVAERYSREIARCERQIGQLFRRLEAQGRASICRAFESSDRSELQDTLEQDETAIEYFTAGRDLGFRCHPRQHRRRARARIEARDRTDACGVEISDREVQLRAGYADDHFEQLNQAANQYLGSLYRDLSRHRRISLVITG